MKLVSACLVGVKCRYNGESKTDSKVLEEFKKGNMIPVCPEQLGGLTTPRVPIETTGTGEKVLGGKAKALNKEGQDVTENFIRGAEETLNIAKTSGIKEAVLKQESPSCGCGKVYDGTFSGNKTEGDGVTTALLKKNGIKVISEEEF